MIDSTSIPQADDPAQPLRGAGKVAMTRGIPQRCALAMAATFVVGVGLALGLVLWAVPPMGSRYVLLAGTSHGRLLRMDTRDIFVPATLCAGDLCVGHGAPFLHWQPLWHSSQAKAEIAGLDASPDGRTVSAELNTGQVWRSSDRGVHWSQVPGVRAARYSVVSASAPSWLTLPSSISVDMWPVSLLAVSAHPPGPAYIWVPIQGFLVSDDAGRHWESRPLPLYPDLPPGILIPTTAVTLSSLLLVLDPSQPTVAFVSVPTIHPDRAYIAQTLDAGQTWHAWRVEDLEAGERITSLAAWTRSTAPR